MNDSLLINTVCFYLRQSQRLTRAGLGPLTELSGPEEIAVWAYAERAAERLERQRAGLSQAGTPAQADARTTQL